MTDQTDHRPDTDSREVRAIRRASWEIPRLMDGSKPDPLPGLSEAADLLHALRGLGWDVTSRAARPAIEREAKAAAWDEGYSWGWSDAQEAHDVPQEMDRGDWPLCTPNPYRIEREVQA